MIRVLIVDDERISREEIAETLNAVCAMNAEEAGSAEDCLLRLQESANAGMPFDAVVLDIYMRGKNGDEIIPMIRRDYPSIAIVMLTAYASVQTAIKTLRMGAYQYLMKEGFDAERTLAPILRAGVAHYRLKHIRQELLGPNRTTDLYSRAARIIREAIPLPSRFFLAIASPHNDALDVSAWNEAGVETTHERPLEKDHPLAKRIFDEGQVVRSKSGEVGFHPLAPNANSQLAAPIRDIWGDSDGFVDLECEETFTFDEHTKDVLVALAELVAFDRAINRRIDVETKLARDAAESRARADQISATSLEVAHYIRNAVHVLRSSFGLLHESILLSRTHGESANRLTAGVNRHLQHEDNLDEIEGILRQMAAIGQKITIELKPFDLKQAFMAREKNYRAMTECAKASFVFNIPPGEVWVEGDERQLLRAVDMLLENAIEASAKARQSDAVVEFTLTSDEHMARISVRDNGPGFNAEDRAQLFKAQFSTKSNIPLRGIGLFTANRIVLEHNGVVRPIDIVPSGTEFVIELPLGST
jgi:signal transduction histidine kinase/DNA-binding NarL/FixJ family response regulator